jgi:hypothetical protein
MSSRGRSAAGAAAVWVPVALFAVALVLALNPWPFENQVAPATQVPAWATDPTPVRRPTMRPEYVVAGYTYRCSDCHDILPSPPETYRTLTQHTEIELKHGINTRCFNCHHRSNRDAFADDSGGEIPWDQPQLVCAKCHGPVYRDWQNRSHGRTDGYWDESRGPRGRRKCTECHDPHQPPFPPMRPAPPPNTLRMGPQEVVEEHGHDPLRIRHEDAGAGTVEERP